jgi:hypothetical protein
MLKLLLIPALLVVITLCGCQVFRRSDTWAKVTEVRVDTRSSHDPSSAYADELHRTLASERVEHKIVTYQYRYTTRLREEAVATRTAVIYRDQNTPGYPWWLMDDRTGKPVWLPNGDVQKQVQFYLRDRAEVVELREFASDGSTSGKATVSDSATERPGVLARIGRSISRVAGRSRPANERERREEFLRARTGIEEQAIASVSEEQLAKLFREKHGTTYDPASSLDREKMAALRPVALTSVDPVSRY